jgi:hypothetical protein
MSANQSYHITLSVTETSVFLPEYLLRKITIGQTIAVITTVELGYNVIKGT